MANDHTRLRELFIAACDLGESEQSALIEEECADDPGLRAALERLLRKDDATSGLLADDDVGARIDVHVDSLGETRPPEHIGQYTVRRLIGEGGMGVVYLAEQENPRREVAVKVIRSGLIGRELRRRFELEAAVLGRLQHPGIAQVYEAGMYDDGSGGRPFFAMEYVDGLPLNAFIKSHEQTVANRLGLFIRICDAVHHAHQRGVIHRDLKPGNILIGATEPRNDKPMTRTPSSSWRLDAFGGAFPKILDFGVARAIDSDLQISTLRTGVGQLIGTLPYMSPEQVAGRVDDVDIRSDVYALGVILYELLADRLPYDLSNQSIVSAARIINEDDPAALTTINRAYRGDLNTIVRKALEKDADRRYQSASDLAADVQRYLSNEPIVARPATTMYQLRKFARRHRGLVAGVVAAFLVLIGGVVVASVLAIGQTRALRESERQRSIAEAVNSFLNDDLLAKANPYTGEAHDVSLREVLDTASEQIEMRFADAPLVHAAIRRTLAKTYFNLGLFDSAEEHAQRALAVYDNEEGAASDAASALRDLLVNIYLQDSRLTEAAELIDAQLAVRDPHGDETDVRAAQAYENRAMLQRKLGHAEDAVLSYRKAISIFEQCTDEPPRNVLTAKQNLGFALSTLSRYDEALELLNEVLEKKRTLYGERSADVSWTLTNIGDVYWRQGRFDLARPVFELAYDIRLERLGESHLETVRSLYAIGLVQSGEGDYEAAEKTQRRVLAAREELLDPSHFDYIASLRAVGNTLYHQDRASEAIPYFLRAWILAQDKYGPEHSRARQFRTGVLNVIRKSGEHERAREVYTAYCRAIEDWIRDGRATHDHLGGYAWELLTCEIEEFRNPHRALELAQDAIASGGGQDPAALETLARALAANGRLLEAVAAMESCIEFGPDMSEQARERRLAALAEYTARLQVNQ